MRAYDLIQVLWVEDDPKVTDSYPQDAEYYGLELVPFSCWDDAREALERDFDRWSAIILDAKCKYHRDSADNAIVFLREALVDISTICEKKGRMIPWYVLTGGDDSEVSDSINDKRLKWDKDWTDSRNKKYYSKNVDNEILYRRIKYHAHKSPRFQIQKMYRNVFEAIEECGIDNEGYNALEDLLVPIHFPDEIDSNDYNDKFKKARVALEYIFRSMSEHGMLPQWGDEVNLRWSCCILSGLDALNKKEAPVIKSNKRVLPILLCKVLKEMADILPADVHSASDNPDRVNIPEYLYGVDNSTFLLKSFALQLCDLILWYRNYLREHPDEELNALEWDVLNKNAIK
jgi:hypothetical protein